MLVTALSVRFEPNAGYSPSVSSQVLVTIPSVCFSPDLGHYIFFTGLGFCFVFWINVGYRLTLSLFSSACSWVNVGHYSDSPAVLTTSMLATILTVLQW